VIGWKTDRSYDSEDEEEETRRLAAEVGRVEGPVFRGSQTPYPDSNSEADDRLSDAMIADDDDFWE
jgi:hypothetical protein